MGWLDFTGMKTHQDLITEQKIQHNKINYNEILSKYVELLNRSGYYHDQYYKAYSYNNPSDTEYYSKEIEKIEAQINEFENKYPWVSQEVNRFI